MFNKVRLSTIDYTTGRAPQPLSVPLAALKDCFPQNVWGFHRNAAQSGHTALAWICLGCAAPFWSEDKLLKKMVFAAG